MQNKENKLKIPLILIGAGIIVFSIREFLKYGLADGGDTVLDELQKWVQRGKKAPDFSRGYEFPL